MFTDHLGRSIRYLKLRFREKLARSFLIDTVVVGFVMLSARSVRISGKTIDEHPITPVVSVLAPTDHYCWYITQTGC